MRIWASLQPAASRSIGHRKCKLSLQVRVRIEPMAEDEIDELFLQTLQGDYNDEEPWKAVRSLQGIGSRQVFEMAVKWTESTESLTRARGLDVIAQLGRTAVRRSNSFPEESYEVVVKAIQREREIQPLCSAISALGHLEDPRGIPLIAGFHSHGSDDVRFNVACALGSYPNDSLSVRTLLTLMEDADAEVRDWATFGLGALGDRDSPEIREALFRRLNDEDVNAREEALVGLAKRHDTRILPCLMKELDQPEVTCLVVEAASTLLGFSSDREDWSQQDYIKELRARFSNVGLEGA